MYQSGQNDLLAYGLEIVDTGGLKALTLRSLAQKAGVSPSLLNYHFGSRDGLVARLFEYAQDLDAQFWRGCSETVAAMTLSPHHVPVVSLSIVQTCIQRARSLERLRWICSTLAARDPGYLGRAGEWAALPRAFWTGLLRQVGADEALGPALAAAMSGAIRTGLVAHDNLLVSAWVSDIVLRATERLLHLPLTMQGDSPARARIEALAQASLAPRPEGRTDTPKRILSIGPDAVTHRDIAGHAGVSLSSLTHHFSSLDEILRGAFERIYSRAQHEYEARLPTRMTLDELMQTVLPAMFEQAASRAQEATAMDEIILCTSRDHDTAPISSGLMSMVGRTSTAIVRAVAGELPVDRLDGQVFRFTLTGLSEQGLHMAAPERDRYVMSHCEAFLRRWLP